MPLRHCTMCNPANVGKRTTGSTPNWPSNNDFVLASTSLARRQADHVETALQVSHATEERRDRRKVRRLATVTESTPLTTALGMLLQVRLGNLHPSTFDASNFSQCWAAVRRLAIVIESTLLTTALGMLLQVSSLTKSMHSL